MNSMTGYGKGIAEGYERKITVEIKSVNHRFLDLLFKFPRNFQFAESLIRSTVSERVSRGHLDIYLNYEDNRINTSVSLNENLVASYIKIGKRLAELGVADDLSASTLIKVPDMVKQTAVEDDETILAELVKQAVSNALDALIVMRASEGARLVADLLAKVNELETLTNEVALRAPEVAAEYREKLTARVKDALNSVEIDTAKVASEVAFFIDKSNIDEELTRLRGHISHYREIFERKEPSGKQLDFLTQEANREVNTIGSKCNDMQITNNVLRLKNLVEMIREQIQNLE